MKAFNHKQRFQFVTPSDMKKPEEERTRWSLRPLTIVDESEIETEIGPKGARDRSMPFAMAVVRRAIDGVSNLANPAWTAGQDDGERFIRFERGEDGHASKAFMASIDQLTFLELFMRVIRGEALETVEAGKS